MHIIIQLKTGTILSTFQNAEDKDIQNNFSTLFVWVKTWTTKL